MKVLSQLLGRYSSNHKPLILFRLPDTDTLFYRLSDIEPLFSLPPQSFKQVNYKNCYRDHEDTYLNTTVLSELAHHFNCHLLTELCKLKPNDYNLGLADAILQTFPQFKRAPKEEHIWESVQLPLENLEDVIERESQRTIKTEPTSPPSIYQVLPESRNAMALDKVLINDSRRPNEDHSSNKRQKTDNATSSPSSNESTSLDRDKRPHSLSAVTNGSNAQPPLLKPSRKIHSYPNVLEADEQQHMQAPSSYYHPSQEVSFNDKKRLSNKHKNALNLTIFAPSYHEQLNGIRSAPINSNFHKTVPSQQTQHNKPKHIPSNLSSLQNIAPASATIARPPFAHQISPRRHEFAIPPIVPSQQQPPHSAHPTSRENLQYQQYAYNNGSNSSYKAHPPPPLALSSNYKRAHESQSQIPMSAANVPLPPKTPTTNSFAALQRQQYLQPFEHLFDTIETTRTLKTTLDDQIRRSSSLMQTLQASATTIEGLVRNQVKEAQWELVKRVEQTIEDLVHRIEVLEGRVKPKDKRTDLKVDVQQQQGSLPSPLPTSTREDNDELQTPPTIVRSQNDIGPQEYHSMLNALRDRLDRLERQIDN